MESQTEGPPPERIVLFRCVQEGSKLRIRIASPGYLPEANCQFPRAIRRAGATYQAPASAVTTSQRSANGKYFYRVRASAVKEIGSDAFSAREAERTDLSRLRIFEEEGAECVVCMDREKSEVFVPCGHFCCCQLCIPLLKGKCPMCRGAITIAVNRSQIES